MKTLEVLIAGAHAGQIRQNDDGRLAFAYKSDYLGIPLSIAMPANGSEYGDRVVRPYLAGLLPDDLAARRSIAREFGASANNPFSLLSFIGLDCPGAIQICSDLDSSANQSSELAPITEAQIQIAERLRMGRIDASSKWEADGEHWSIGGQQAKFALQKRAGEWYSCQGSAATTHILKPGISHLKYEALNEYLCLKLAAACGIPSAKVEYHVFEDEPAIVVTRYDRTQLPNGDVIRLHQEDFCQALGVLPTNKYPEDGGPGANDIIELLATTGEQAKANITRFVSMLFFNCLIGAPDAHAKNYSLLIGPGAFYLAPLYDVASMAPYTKRIQDIRLAMGIGGENKVGKLSKNKIEKLCRINNLERFGFTTESLVEHVVDLAERTSDNVEKVIADNLDIPGVDELGSRLISGVTEICNHTRKKLG